MIKFDEPISLEEPIKILKNYFEQSKNRSESIHDWKGNDKNKIKFYKKRGRLRDAHNKENATLHKKFNASDREHGL